MPTETDLSLLNRLHALPGIARIVSGNGGLPKIEIASPAASAEIYLHGAHLTSWRPTGAEEVIFVSEKSSWQAGKAIRGGVPICFPWFRAKADDPKAPAHGFVRTREWQLESITAEGSEVVVTLATGSDEASHAWWPYDFRIVHCITIGAELRMDLIVSNTGRDPFQFEEALHTYHRIGSIHTVEVSGLDGVTYWDNRDENRSKVQSGDVSFAAPTDNAYVQTAHPVEIVDPSLQRRIQIEKQNSQTTIVWTPWQQGAAAMADMGDDEWQQFVCVEASNILAAAVTLAPGESHTMSAMIGVPAARR